MIEQFVISGVEANAAGKKHHVAIVEFTEILMAGSAKRRTKVQGPMKRRLGPQSLVIALHPDRFKDTPFESVLNQVTQKLNARRDELAGRI